MDRKGRNIALGAPLGPRALEIGRRNAHLTASKRVLAIIFLLVPLFLITAYAKEGSEVFGTSEYGNILSDFESIVPESVREWLPNELLSELEKGEEADPSIIANNFQNTDLINLLKKAGKAMLQPFLDALIGCMGLTVTAAIISALRPIGGTCQDALHFLVSVSIALSLWKIGYNGILILSEALTTVSVFMRAMLPSVAILYAIGGNFTAAAAEEGILLILLEVMETLCAEGLRPMLQVAFSLAIAAHLAGEGRLQGISTMTCRTITFILAFLATLLTTVFAYQHSIAASADSLLLRSVKFAASGVIPVIGGALSEAVGSMGGAISFLRSTVGGVATVVVLIIMLVPCMQLLGTRLALTLSSLVANALGCPKESGLFIEIGSIFDLAMAILTICFFALLFVMAMMSRCVIALG